MKNTISTEYKWFKWVSIGAMVIGATFLFLGFTKAFAAGTERIMYTAASGIYIKNADDSSDGSLSISGAGNLAFTTSKPDGQYIVYVNVSDGNKLYKRLIDSTGAGTAINSTSSLDPDFSPDGNYIIYTNVSDGNKIYKKSANDTSNGSAITSVGGYQAKFSPDGNYIIYVKTGGFTDIMKKNANDSSEGSIIATNIKGNWHNGLEYSKDGTYIFYINTSYKIAKKSATDTSNGTEITSNDAYAFSVNKNDTEISYTNKSNSYKIYKKSATDTSNGTAINNQTSYFLSYVYVSPASCNDGEINQDETSADYGGVCGTCSDGIQQTEVTNPELGVDYGGRCEQYNGEVKYKGCEVIKQYVSGTSSTNLMFGYVSTPSYTYMYTQTGSQGYNNESVAVYNGTANRDIFELYNFPYQGSQVINTGSIVFDGTTQSKINTPQFGNAQMFVMSIRSSSTQKFNFLKFGGAISTISTVGNIDNHVGEVEFNIPGVGVSKTPLVLSGGVAVAYTKNGLLADSALITFDRTSKSFSFSSFGLYSLSSFYTMVNCGNGSYNCENVYRGNDTFACSRNPRAWLGNTFTEEGFSWASAVGTLWGSYSPSQYYSDVACHVGTATVPVIINTQGDITTVSGPSCIPNKTDGTLTTNDGFQVDYTTNGSGAITSVNVKPLPFDSKVMCAGDEYDGFSGSLKCVLKFFFYYYDKMTGTQEDTMKILSQAIQVGYTKGKNAPPDITIGTKPNEKPTNALALAGYNAWDRTASGTNGISQTYRLWKYALYILITVVVISMMFYFLNRKQ